MPGRRHHLRAIDAGRRPQMLHQLPRPRQRAMNNRHLRSGLRQAIDRRSRRPARAQHQDLLARQRYLMGAQVGDETIGIGIGAEIAAEIDGIDRANRPRFFVRRTNCIIASLCGTVTLMPI